jgi:hypothetical protein
MAFKYQRSSTDLNQPEIVEALRKFGAIVFNVTCSKGFCDLVVCYNGEVTLIEVKDGSKPESQRRLTPRELEAVRLVNTVGCQIYIVNSIDEAISLISG